MKCVKYTNKYGSSTIPIQPKEPEEIFDLGDGRLELVFQFSESKERYTKIVKIEDLTKDKDVEIVDRK